MSRLQRLAIALDQLQGQQLLLKPEQAHYLGHVLRLRPGERFVAMDGSGHSWLAEFQSQQLARLLESLVFETELPTNIILLAAPPKGNGFEQVVRQATELGVSQIIPLLSDRTLLKPSAQKLARWRRIAQEAAEQSQRQLLPDLMEPVPFPQIQTFQQEQRYLCVTTLAPHLLTMPIAPGAAVVIATGPEGGWTSAEVEQAIVAGFQPVSLGQRILRAVTAPVVALSLVSARLEVPAAE